MTCSMRAQFVEQDRARAHLQVGVLVQPPLLLASAVVVAGLLIPLASCPADGGEVDGLACRCWLLNPCWAAIRLWKSRRQGPDLVRALPAYADLHLLQLLPQRLRCRLIDGGRECRLPPGIDGCDARAGRQLRDRATPHPGAGVLLRLCRGRGLALPPGAHPQRHLVQEGCD